MLVIPFRVPLQRGRFALRISAEELDRLRVVAEGSASEEAREAASLLLRAEETGNATAAAEEAGWIVHRLYNLANEVRRRGAAYLEQRKRW